MNKKHQTNFERLFNGPLTVRDVALAAGADAFMGPNRPYGDDSVWKASVFTRRKR